MIRCLLSVSAVGLTLVGTAAAQVRPYETSWRHTIKFICGNVADTERHLLHRGNYRTTISIYNPDFMPASVTIQATTMDPTNKDAVARDRKKHVVDIGPHGVQLIGCDQLTGKYQADDTKPDESKVSGYGLLMITAKDQLDVTAVYTAAGKDATTDGATAKAAGEVTSFSIIQPARTRVRSCVPRAKIDLSVLTNWETDAAAKPAPFSIRPGKDDLESGRRWMIYPRASTNSDYSYFLKYCVCSGSGELSGNMRSEGPSAGTLHAGIVGRSDTSPTELWPLQRQGNPKGGTEFDINSRSKKIDKVGDGFIEVRINGRSSVISFKAELILQDGHAGQCSR